MQIRRYLPPSGLHFQVELSAASSQTVTVDYPTQPGTAIPGHDYLPVSGTLILPPEQVTATIAVTLFDDAVDEPDKTVVLALANPIHCSLVNLEAVGVIRDDDVTLPTFDRNLFLPALRRQ
jgi:fibronectin-binding autotransporter adhesin